MAKWLDATELGNRSAYYLFWYDEHMSEWMRVSACRCVWKCVDAVDEVDGVDGAEWMCGVGGCVSVFQCVWGHSGCGRLAAWGLSLVIGRKSA